MNHRITTYQVVLEFVDQGAAGDFARMMEERGWHSELHRVERVAESWHEITFAVQEVDELRDNFYSHRDDES
jgi:hypothetical protein